MKPSSILTVKEAIDLINSDTPTNPVVDNVELIKRTEYLRSNERSGDMNYTIWLVKKGKNGQIVPNGRKWANITSTRERQDLENAIVDHYKKYSGREVDPAQLGMKKQTTITGKDGVPSGRPHSNNSSNLKFGDPLITDSTKGRTVEGY